MICDKRTENHNFTITTNMSQHVEFFHSLIFSIIAGNMLYFDINLFCLVICFYLSFFIVLYLASHLYFKDLTNIPNIASLHSSTEIDY